MKDSLPIIESAGTNINVTDVYRARSRHLRRWTLAIALEENVAYEGSVFRDDPITLQGKTITCYSGQGLSAMFHCVNHLRCRVTPYMYSLETESGKQPIMNGLKNSDFMIDRESILPVEAARCDSIRSPASLDFCQF